MRTVRGPEELTEPLHRSAVTIGNFDGVHLAHRVLLARAVTSAKATDSTAVAVTFDPHPAAVLAPERAPRLLTSLEERIGLIAQQGVDVLVILPFTRELASLSPEEFVDRILVEKLRATVVQVGWNFQFGHRRSGNAETLAALGKERGFLVETLPALEIRGEPVSSSRIRQLLSQGDASLAGRMLGRPFALGGAMVAGEGIGHRQTVPTLNLAVPADRQLPANGVYVTRTQVAGISHESVTNVGHKPTFGPHGLTIESYLLNFSGEIHSEEMRIEFLYRLRNELTFPDSASLKQQIEKDVRRAKQFFRLFKALRSQSVL